MFTMLNHFGHVVILAIVQNVVCDFVLMFSIRLNDVYVFNDCVCLNHLYYMDLIRLSVF